MNIEQNSDKGEKALRIGSVVRSYFKNNSADDIIIDLWYYVALTPLAIVENKKKWVRIAVLPILFPWAAFFFSSYITNCINITYCVTCRDNLIAHNVKVYAFGCN